MNLKDHILLWNHALIEIIDIRHTSQHFSDMNSHYQLPSSAFLLIIHGKAQIMIDDVPHEISSFHILHGGKGMDIQFLRTEELLGYYLILYKANLSLSSRNNFFRSSYDGMADLTQNPIWNNIPAVKEGRLMEIDFGLGYYSKSAEIIKRDGPLNKVAISFTVY